MGNRPKCSFIHSLFLLMSCVVAVTAETATPKPSQNGSQHQPLYYPQRHDFPSEQLYKAYFVIHHFKNTITCDPRNITTTWTGNDICGKTTYLGFYCATSQGHGNLTVTSVIFNGFGLCAPELQGFVDQLPDLAHFQATSNNFGGKVPSRSALTFTDSLRFAGPQTQTGLLLGGYGNNYGGKISSHGDLGYVLTHPEDPPTISIITPKDKNPFAPSKRTLVFRGMRYLALANNKLTGPIPPSIATFQDSLLEVLLLNNQLSGCLPNELGALHKAAVIDAGKNQLTGPIPSTFSCLSSVEQLNLAENCLYGAVPDALCKLAAGPAGRLANLTLSGNYFTSVGPSCAALIKDGVLDVKNNCIPGLANQRRPAECAAFQSQPKTACPAASTQVTCPAAAAANAVATAPAERKAREYSSYVTYATLHE